MKSTNIIICIILFCTIILIIQPPFAFYSPDISYHASKILRSSEGDFFSDPFSGTLSIYHPFYHVFFGLILNLFFNNTLEVMWIAGLVIFCGFIISYFYVSKIITNSNTSALMLVLISPCLFYSPTGHSFILENPSGFGLIFLLFGFAFFFTFLFKNETATLFFSFFLFGIAVTTWWFYFIPLAVLITVSLIFFTSKLTHRVNILAPIGFIIPNIFSLYHILSVNSIIPLHKTATASINPPDIIFRSLFSLITRGNFQFSQFLFPNFFETTPNGEFILYNISLLYSLAASFQFFCIAIPVTIFVLLSPLKKIGIFFKKNVKRRNYNLNIDHETIILTSAIIGYAIIIVSSVILIIGNDAHLQRVHFVGLICILPAAIFQGYHIPKFGIKILIILGAISLLFTVIHTPSIGFGIYEPSDATKDIITIIEKNPYYQNNRIFLTEDSLRKIAPFTRINGYIGHKNGTYYSQDPVTSRILYAQYISIMNKTAIKPYSSSASRNHILVLNKKSELDIIIIDKYMNISDIVKENSEWIVMKAPFSSTLPDNNQRD